MAKCPNCGKALHFWNVKAECPHCKINIPNHNWEERLEEDALARESSFFKMYSNLAKLKFAAIGNPLRIVRLIVSFLPIIGYIIPWGDIHITKTDGTVIGTDTVNAISLFTNDTFKLSTILSLLTDETNLEANKPALIALILAGVSLLFGVIAFFLIPILFKKPRNPVIAIFHGLATVTYFLAPHFLNVFLESRHSYDEFFAQTTIFADIGGLLFLAAFIVDIIVCIKPLDKDDGKYIPKDELQREYAVKIGAISEEGESDG